jgi:hypothetical protein
VCAALACAVALQVAARPARAVSASEVEGLVRQGIDLRHAGQDGRALPFFRKAYDAERTPRTAGQLGLCELALGYWVDAEDHLGEAISSTGNPWVEKNRATLATSLASARANVGSLSVLGGPSGAKVFLDNREVGALPLDRPLRVNKGPHDIEVRAPGPVTRSKTMVVQGADEQTVTLVLETKPLQTAPTPAPAAPPVLVTPAPAPDAPHASSTRTLAWAVGGVAAAALVLGVIETVSWSSNVQKFDDHTSPSNPTVKDCGSGDAMYGGPGCQSIHDDLTRARAFAIVGYGLAAVGGVGSAILFATSQPAEPKTSAAVTCAPDIVERGLSCRMTF